MLPTVLALMFTLCRVGSQVVLTVLPVVVEPDVTPSFTLSCLVAEQQQGQIVSISIYRRAVTVQQAKVSPKEVIAELRGPAPGQLFVVSSHVNLTAQGQIAPSEAEVAAMEALVDQQVWLTPHEQELAVQRVELAAIQAELGSSLVVTWPSPSVQDLGVYTCEANLVGVAEGVTFFAEVQVTSSTAATDRLLVNILKIERQADIFNATLAGIQSEVNNITAVLGEVRSTRNELNTTKPDEAVINALPEVVPDRSPPKENVTEGSVPVTTGSDLKRLTDALENLGIKFDRFNDTLERLDRIITAIEVKVVELSPTNISSKQQAVELSPANTSGNQKAVELSPANTTGNQQAVDLSPANTSGNQQAVEISQANTTSNNQVVLDEVHHRFTIGNTSYVLFYAFQNATADRAQAVCGNGQLQLAEINGTEEFLIISDSIAPFVDNSSLVVVGGRRAAGQNVWSFQDGQQVTFFAGGPVEASNSTNDECLALNSSVYGFTFTPLTCTSDLGFLSFLCQQRGNVY